MRRVAKAVVEAGLVDEATLAQIQKWGVPIEAAPEKTLHTQAEVLEHIRESIESEEMVRIDETDLDMLQVFLDSSLRKKGRLILKEGKKHRTLTVEFSKTTMGDIAIPWTSEDEPAILLNDGTHLKWKEGDTEYDVLFRDYRSVYFGEKRAFVVCEVTK